MPFWCVALGGLQIAQCSQGASSWTMLRRTVLKPDSVKIIPYWYVRNGIPVCPLSSASPGQGCLSELLCSNRQRSAAAGPCDEERDRAARRGR